MKVLDFGLAKLMDSEATPEDQTVTVSAHVGLSAPGTIAGTAAYMSPEQATGGKVDARSDIFSFGAMLYEMVTGQRAFAGSPPWTLLAAVVREQPKPPSADPLRRTERPGEGDPALPAEGSGAAIPAH